jgi:hypothetical protein
MALIALTVGMVPSIPNRRGASPKPTWRQTQAGVAPNPNPCQLFPIAAHCRFEPFQGLARSRKRRPAFAPCRPFSFRRKHIRRQFCSRPIFLLARSPCRQARLPWRASSSDQCEYVGCLPISARAEAKKFCPFLNPFSSSGRAVLAGSRGGRQTKGRHIPGKSRLVNGTENASVRPSWEPVKARSLKPTANAIRAASTALMALAAGRHGAPPSLRVRDRPLADLVR